MRIVPVFLPLVLILVGCGGGNEARPAAAAAPAKVAPRPAGSPAKDAQPVAGQQTFVIVPAESTASYMADEEFFAGALKKLGINAGKRKVVGTTQAVEGQFQLDPARPTAQLGENRFTVKMNTFRTDQERRDKYIREDGPGFDSYPLAVFKGTAISGDGLTFKLAGDITIREITKPTTFEVKAQLVGDALTGVATTRLRMSDFGIEPLDFYNTLTVADEIGIEVRFTARQM